MTSRVDRPRGWTAQDEADADSLTTTLQNGLEDLYRSGLTLTECIEIIRSADMGPCAPSMLYITLGVRLDAIKWLRRRFALGAARK